MACAAIKRSIDWDPLNSSPSQRPSKRLRGGPTTPLRQSSPFPIRPKAQTACEFLSVTICDLCSCHTYFPHEKHVVAISESIQQEAKRFQRHQQQQQLFQRPCLSPSSSAVAAAAAGSAHTDSLLVHVASPSAYSSPTSGTTLSSPLSPSSSSSSAQNSQTPVFTFKQVSLICERLLRDQENQIREEYDKVLETKLAEQYDTFVKFTYDQIQKRFEAGATPSCEYLPLLESCRQF